MKYSSAALLAVVAIAGTFDASGVSAFAPATPVVQRMSNANVAAPVSSTELNMGLRSFFSRNKKVAQSTAGSDITKDEVRALFSLWNNALATGDSRLVASRYAVKSGAVLLPTVSDVPRDDFDSIKDYFDGFLLREPQGEIHSGDIRIGDGWAQDCGIYEFTMGATGDKVKGRYSFIYVYEGNQWKISHHHSSVMPEGIDITTIPIKKEEVQNLFHLWNDALATGDSSLVASRYAANGVLLPTVSDIPRDNAAKITNYFDDFLQKKPQGDILESFVTIGTNWCQDVGIYELTLGATGDKVKARYSFVYVYEDGQWKIAHHHSSQYNIELYLLRSRKRDTRKVNTTSPDSIVL